MSDHVLRIFSYLPNPRVWKALIAADYLGVSVEVLGDKPKNLGNWLWDFDARELAEEEKTVKKKLKTKVELKVTIIIISYSIVTLQKIKKYLD